MEDPPIVWDTMPLEESPYLPQPYYLVPVDGFCRGTDSTISALWKSAPELSVISVVAARECETLRGSRLSARLCEPGSCSTEHLSPCFSKFKPTGSMFPVTVIQLFSASAEAFYYPSSPPTDWPAAVWATHNLLGRHELAVKFGNSVPHLLLSLNHHLVLLSGSVGKSHIPVPIPGGLIDKLFRAVGPKNLDIFSLRLGSSDIPVSSRGWVVSFLLYELLSSKM